MKAAICREFGKPLVIEEVELLPPKTGEVQVKLAACAICHSDILYAEGAWGGDLPAVWTRSFRSCGECGSWSKKLSARRSCARHADSFMWNMSLLFTG